VDPGFGFGGRKPNTEGARMEGPPAKSMGVSLPTGGWVCRGVVPLRNFNFWIVKCIFWCTLGPFPVHGQWVYAGMLCNCNAVMHCRGKAKGDFWHLGAMAPWPCYICPWLQSDCICFPSGSRQTNY